MKDRQTNYRYKDITLSGTKQIPLAEWHACDAKNETKITCIKQARIGGTFLQRERGTPRDQILRITCGWGAWGQNN